MNLSASSSGVMAGEDLFSDVDAGKGFTGRLEAEPVDVNVDVDSGAFSDDSWLTEALEMLDLAVDDLRGSKAEIEGVLADCVLLLVDNGLFSLLVDAISLLIVEGLRGTSRSLEFASDRPGCLSSRVTLEQ